MLKGKEKEIERIRQQINWMETRPSSDKMQKQNASRNQTA